jgi:hypothetical protein
MRWASRSVRGPLGISAERRIYGISSGFKEPKTLILDAWLPHATLESCAVFCGSESVGATSVLTP